MKGLRYTLLADGSSDKLLMHIVDWSVRRLSVRIEQANWADLSKHPVAIKRLTDQVPLALELYPCDVLFVHRDAEKEPPEQRISEIAEAVQDHPYVPVVPVRMTEAWLLHDVQAIRRASGNPNGNIPIHLPARVENEADPKQVLFDLLLTATEFKGRRRKKAEKQQYHMRLRLAELIEDYSALDSLPAFERFTTDLRSALRCTGHLPSR